MLLTFLPASSANQPTNYKQWVNVDAGKLLALADSFGFAGQSDSALTLYTIITSRYDDRMSKDECLITAKAYEGMWSAYFLAYSNFSKAYDCTQQEIAILRKLGIERPRVYLDLGALYQTVGDLTHDKESGKRALGYYQRAFSIALSQHDEAALTTIFANLIIVAYQQGTFNSIDGLWKSYNSYRFSKPNQYVEFNKLMYQAVLSITQKRTDEARRFLEDQLKLMKYNGNNIRYRLQSYLFLSLLKTQDDNYPKAKDYLLLAEKELSHFEMDDVSAELYDHLYTVCQAMGESDQALHYRNLYLEAKDNIINYQMLRSFGQLSFQKEVDKMSDEIITMRATEVQHRRILIIGSLITLIILSMLFVIYRKNRRLSSTLKALYDKSVSSTSAHTITSNVAKNESPVTDELVEKISKVMSDPSIFCSQSFTVEQLAGHVGSSYKVVSATIRDAFHCNFSTILNQSRVEEACRRINSDVHFRGYTVEGMATSVGYRSRNSFSAAFKRVTGLYPSEYVREAKAKAEAKTLDTHNVDDLSL